MTTKGTRPGRPTNWPADYTRATAALRQAQGAFAQECRRGDDAGLAGADRLGAAASDVARWLARHPCPIPAAQRHLQAGVRSLRRVAELAQALPSAVDPKTAAAAVVHEWSEAERHFRAFARILINARLVGHEFKGVSE